MPGRLWEEGAAPRSGSEDPGEGGGVSREELARGARMVARASRTAEGKHGKQTALPRAEAGKRGPEGESEGLDPNPPAHSRSFPSDVPGGDGSGVLPGPSLQDLGQSLRPQIFGFPPTPQSLTPAAPFKQHQADVYHSGCYDNGMSECAPF